MKLSSIIAKEIRLKHLNSGILHNATRNKYRNYKLKEHYQTPAASAGQLVIYSNPQGNQFVFKQHHFHAAAFPHPAETYEEVTALQREINQTIYALWLENKAHAARECFPIHRRLLLWSMVALWTAALLLVAAANFAEPIAKAEETIEWTIIVAIAVTVLANAAAFARTICAKYSPFEYDNEVVKAVARRMKAAESRLREYGVEVSCDREATWICFRAEAQSTRKPPEMHLEVEEEEAEDSLG